MPRELSFFGIYVPTLLAALPVAVVLYFALDAALARGGAYRWVWHGDLFRVGLFALIFSAVGLLCYSGS